MKVGVSLWFQNIPDFLSRRGTRDANAPMPVPDSSVYRDELHLASLLESLGYDSFWTVEHHFGPYAMTCNPLQVLGNIAGRTHRIELGTMVIVLPWHDPIRVAEEVAVLDNLMDGRRLMLGFGRGAAPQEFDGFRVEYADSRDRMEEALDIVRLGLTEESFSYKGRFFDIPEMTIRPRPVTDDLTKNIVLAWSSPETMAWAAGTGGGQLYSNFKTWDALSASAAEFNRIRASRGWHPVPPIGGSAVFCSTDRGEISAARGWFRQTAESSIWHYGVLSQPSFRKRLEGKTGRDLEAATSELLDEATSVGVFGTPQECTERLIEIQQGTSLGHFIANMHFGLMPVEIGPSVAFGCSREKCFRYSSPSRRQKCWQRPIVRSSRWKLRRTGVLSLSSLPEMLTGDGEELRSEGPYPSCAFVGSAPAC